MVRLRVVWYWKRYMRKNRYHYKRYFLPVPKTIGDRLEAKVDYVVQLFGPAIVYLPRGLNLLSRLEKLENIHRENTPVESEVLSHSLVEGSKARERND
jgi:hypothetical protein